MDAVERAREMGFEPVAAVTPDMVPSKRELRDLCNPDDCPHFGGFWSCPPGAGTYEECLERIASKDQGLVVMTVRDGVDFDDTALLDQIRSTHNGRLDQLADELRAAYGEALEFSTGGCDLCDPCTYPDAPCNMPDRQRRALSAHGVDVVQLCANAGLEYGFESGTIRFVGLLLY